MKAKLEADVATDRPFSPREEVMMWEVYLEEIRNERFIISNIKRDKGCQSGWKVGVESRETLKRFVGWDSDWFISMKKYEEIRNKQESEWTEEDTANYQAEERAADAHLGDNDLNEDMNDVE